MIELICFDLDDTLWPCQPVIQRAEEKTWQWLERYAPRMTAALSREQERQLRLEWMQAHPQLAHDLTLVRLGTLKALLREFGYPAELAVRAVAEFRHWRNQVQPYDDVRPVLESLAGRFRLVAVTNGNVQLEQTPLADVFDLFITAAEVGAAKPDPAVFERVRDWSELPFANMLHVGDDPERDVRAAQALGMKTAWLVRSGRRDWPLAEPRPDWIWADLLPMQRLAQVFEDGLG